jgi:hypothetical protein
MWVGIGSGNGNGMCGIPPSAGASSWATTLRKRMVERSSPEGVIRESEVPSAIM